jgi:hypothetical protein
MAINPFIKRNMTKVNKPELSIICVVSSRREFADSAEFKTGGHDPKFLRIWVMSPNSAPVCRFTIGRDNVIYE